MTGHTYTPLAFRHRSIAHLTWSRKIDVSSDDWAARIIARFRGTLTPRGVRPTRGYSPKSTRTMRGGTSEDVSSHEPTRPAFCASFARPPDRAFLPGACGAGRGRSLRSEDGRGPSGAPVGAQARSVPPQDGPRLVPGSGDFQRADRAVLRRCPPHAAVFRQGRPDGGVRNACRPRVSTPVTHYDIANRRDSITIVAAISGPAGCGRTRCREWMA